MTDQEHIQKKPLVTHINQSESSGFTTRGFAEQIESDKAFNQPSPDLKTQLSRAERFGHNLSKMPVPTSPPPMVALQTKTPSTGLGNQAVQRAEEPEDEELQMKSASPAQLATQSQPIQQATSTNSSHSMPEPVRAKMEKSFGTSFSDVNIHTNSAQAKSIGALAYTQGSQIHFAPGQYSPSSLAGQSLLGHELTHVVQQRAGRVPVPQQSKGLPINADSSLEQEADRLGAKAAQGQQVQVPGMTASALTRSGLPVQHSTEPVESTGLGSILDEVSSIDAPDMDLNTYTMLNQQMESLLPQLQQQVMQQPMPGGVQNAVQRQPAAGGAGGGKKGQGGGLMGKAKSKLLGK